MAPLRKRFRYHFYGERKTNAQDKVSHVPKPHPTIRVMYTNPKGTHCNVSPNLVLLNYPIIVQSSL